MAKRGDQIRQFILNSTPAHAKGVASLAAKKFGITRQSINVYMRGLIEKGLIQAEGNTKNRRYKLATLFKSESVYGINGLEEHVVWQDDIAPLFEGQPENIIDIWFYGCTEMINNVIDHSDGTRLYICIEKDAVRTSIWIDDDGVGIFKKIMEACHLEDERHAVLELSKGKLTTDPDNHTGEGIFFSSRMFDRYYIFSGDVTFSHDYDFDGDEEEDWIWEREDRFSGTQILMSLENNSSRVQKVIYDKYTATEDDYGFTKTVVPVRLAKHGPEKLVSRSQGKRLMARVDRFKTVILDFTGIETIGQAFADEIFRVFVNNHPDVKVSAAFANKDIRRAIKRARL